MVLFLQVPAGRRFGLLRHAGPCLALAGVLLAAACLLLGLSGTLTGGLTVLVLVLAGSLHALGEILHATGSWSAGFELAPNDAQGQYQGLFATGVGAGQTMGPLLVTALILPNETLGWILIAAILATAGFLMPIAIRRASVRIPGSASLVK